MTPQQIKPLQSPAILVQDNQSSAAKSSILYTMIPVAVKARLPKIPSLRKSRSASSFDQAKELLPSHSRRPVSADLSECETLLDDSALSSLQPCKPSTDPVLARSKPEATASWKYANQGLGRVLALLYSILTAKTQGSPFLKTLSLNPVILLPKTRLLLDSFTSTPSPTCSKAFLQISLQRNAAVSTPQSPTRYIFNLNIVTRDVIAQTLSRPSSTGFSPRASSSSSSLPPFFSRTSAFFFAVRTNTNASTMYQKSFLPPASTL